MTPDPEHYSKKLNIPNDFYKVENVVIFSLKIHPTLVPNLPNQIFKIFSYVHFDVPIFEIYLVM